MNYGRMISLKKSCDFVANITNSYKSFLDELLKPSINEGKINLAYIGLM